MNPPIIEYMPVLNTLNDFDKGYMTDCVESDTGGYLEVLNGLCYDKISINIVENGDDDEIVRLKGELYGLNNTQSTCDPNNVQYQKFRDSRRSELTSQIDFLNNIKDDTSHSRVDYTTPYMCPRDKIRAVCKKGLWKKV